MFRNFFRNKNKTEAPALNKSLSVEQFKEQVLSYPWQLFDNSMPILLRSKLSDEQAMLLDAFVRVNTDILEESYCGQYPSFTLHDQTLIEKVREKLDEKLFPTQTDPNAPLEVVGTNHWRDQTQTKPRGFSKPPFNLH